MWQNTNEISVSQNSNRRISYSPKVQPEHVARLYRLKEFEPVSLTKHVMLAIEDYLQRKEEHYLASRKEEPDDIGGT